MNRSIEGSQRCVWHPKRPAHACLDCYLNNIGLEPKSVEWFYSAIKPSMFVRYRFDRNGIIHRFIEGRKT